MTAAAPHPGPGSSASARPRSRWLAREAPRQLIAGFVPLALFTWLLLESRSAVLDSPDPFDIAFTTMFIWLYGLFMVALAALYVGLTWFAFRRLAGEELRRLAVSSAPDAQTQRWMRWLGIGEVSLAMWSAAATAMTTALLLTLPGGLREGPAVPGALFAAAAAWVLIVVGFATRYLRVWAVHGAIAFETDDDPPEFSDFVHLAVQQSTGYGGAAGRLRTAEVRRTATVHNLLAWAFNSVIVALLVSLALATVL
ncbi:MAG: DUF1345 domain-containing protein [Microbacteriaceae bacterium]|nr:DUF1345 domain-containing protein [Microbacteriaceae bacterium]